MMRADGAGNIYELFSKIANQYGDRIAVVHNQEQWTYKQIATLSQRIAANLSLRNITVEHRIGLCSERSSKLIVAMLGILGAGSAYLPLDPEYPDSRLEYLVTDAKPTLIIVVGKVGPAIRDIAQKCGVECIAFDDLLKEESAVTPIPAAPENLAYVIYTSGSTGGPKGNQITHHNVLRLFTSAQPYFDFSENDVWPLLHSYAFDFSVWEIFGALLYGGSLIIPDASEIGDPSRLFQMIIRHKVTILNQTPSFFRLLCDFISTAPESERQKSVLAFIIFGGERLDFPFLQSWYEAMGTETVLVNMYGITETTVHVTLYPLDPAEVARETASVIGPPLPDLGIHLLDESMNPVPSGMMGEIYVEGEGLARGYHGQAARTAEVFQPNPNPQKPGSRIYRTGDLARIDSKNRLIYLGRTGGFIKIRGFRVSLAEVEAALRKCSNITNAVVLPYGENNTLELHAWLLIQGAAPSIRQIHSELAGLIPKFMIPHQFLRIEGIPLTAHGKVDANKLRTMGERLNTGQSSDAPTSAEEAQMLAVWAQALRFETLGVEDDFFTAGGDSMKAVSLVVALMKSGWQVSVQDLIQAGNVRKLAASVTRQPNPPLLSPAAPHSQLASDMQSQMLRHYLRNAAHGNGVYHVQQSFRVTAQALDIPRLLACFEAETLRTLTLKTYFIEQGSSYVRAIHDRPRTLTHQEDWSHHDKAAQQERLFAYSQEDFSHPFDMTKPEGIGSRIAFFKLSPTQARIFFSIHHCIDDGWGQQQFFAKVFGAYERSSISQDDVEDPFNAYVGLQQNAMSDPASINYWKNYPLSSAFLVDENRPVSSKIEELSHMLSPQLMAQSREVARIAHISTKSLYLAVVAKALGRWMEQTAITLGIVVNGRKAELPGALTAKGLYWNIQPFSWNFDAPLQESLQPIHRQLIEQEQYALYPLLSILAQRSPNKDLMASFNYTNFPALPSAGEISTDDWMGIDRFHYPINIGLYCDEENNEYGLRLVSTQVQALPKLANLINFIETTLQECCIVYATFK